MYDPQIFSSGVYGLLKVNWKLRCETPLAIRNGVSILYRDRDDQKSRGIDISFKWQRPQFDSDHEVSALHYGYQVKDNNLESYHFVPASSIRGSLRSWVINHLVLQEYQKNIMPPSKEEEAETKKYLTNIREALENPHSGYQWIASLFGLAFDTRDEEFDLSNAGRLWVETTQFSNPKAQPVQVNGILEEGLAGPDNARRQMTVRNPLDRMTHASKEGGLHHFLEFCKGESFDIHFTILNPQASDLGLLSLWRREIDTGMLRLGALSSIGRGRVSIQDQDYQLWQNPCTQNFKGFELFEPVDDSSNDALAGLWTAYKLSAENLDQFVSYLEGN